MPEATKFPPNDLARSFARLRWLPTALGLVALAAAGLLYRYQPAAYVAILKILFIIPKPTPFIDAQQFPALVACWRHGVDVYTDPSCDPLGRAMDYSPLWLRADFLPAWSNWMGFALDGAFFLSLALLPPVRRRADGLLLLLAVFSSMTVFALERANMDVVMFLLAAVAGWCWARELWVRLAGYGVMMFAGLLKFYPLVLMLLFLRERLRYFIGLCGIAVLLLAGFIWHFHGELREMAQNFPSVPSLTNGFGARELPGGFELAFRSVFHLSAVPIYYPTASGPLVVAAPPHPMFAIEMFFLLILISFAAAFKIAGVPGIKSSVAALTPLEQGFLIIGAALICGCFLAGQNISYRGIHFIFVLPGIFALSAAAGEAWVRRLFRLTGYAIIFVMWGLALQQIVAEISGGTALPITGSAVLAFWFVRELAWWGIVTLLLAVLFCYVAETPLWRTLMRPPA